MSVAVCEHCLIQASMAVKGDNNTKIFGNL